MALAPVIILRTVSVEKLSTVLDLCNARWPNHALHVLTSANRAGELKQDHRVSRVTAYPNEDAGFASLLTRIQGPATSIVIPIGNQTGCGYGNVFQAIPWLITQHYFLAPYCQSLIKTTRLQLNLKSKTEQWLTQVCHPLSQFLTKRILKEVNLKFEINN